MSGLESPIKKSKSTDERVSMLEIRIRKLEDALRAESQLCKLRNLNTSMVSLTRCKEKDTEFVICVACGDECGPECMCSCDTCDREFCYECVNFNKCSACGLDQCNKCLMKSTPECERCKNRFDRLNKIGVYF